MNINFNLARPAADISPVRLVITHRGKVYRKSTGLSVRTARWNARRQMSGDLTADRRLNEIRAGFEERLEALSTDSDVRAAIAEVLGAGPEEADAPGMWDWLDRWAPPPRSSISPSPRSSHLRLSSGQRSAIFASEEVLIPDLILLIEPGAIPVKASKLVCPISYCLRANSISRSLKFSLSITFYVTNTYLLLSTK